MCFHRVNLWKHNVRFWKMKGLNTDARDFVQSMFSSTESPDKVISEMYVKLSLKDFKTLRPDHLVNQNVVNNYCQMVMCRNAKRFSDSSVAVSHKHKCIVMTTDWFDKLTGKTHLEYEFHSVITMPQIIETSLSVCQSVSGSGSQSVNVWVNLFTC